MSAEAATTATTTASKLAALAGTWGRPPDAIAKAALAIAAALFLAAIAGRGLRSVLGMGETPMSRRMFLWIASFAAALLSIVWIAEYLRGGPRIVDATT